MLREFGHSPDVWSVPDAIHRITKGWVAGDLVDPCPYTRPLVGASDVVGMFTNIDRHECLHALQVFLDQNWQFDANGIPKKAKLKRRRVVWVDFGAKARGGAWSAERVFAMVRRALELACFVCGSQVRAQKNGFPLGHHLSAILSRITVAHHEKGRVPALAELCTCGRTHQLLIVRWQDDTFYAQRVPCERTVEQWKQVLNSIYHR
eukprot:gene2255-biopygen4017